MPLPSGDVLVEEYEAALHRIREGVDTAFADVRCNRGSELATAMHGLARDVGTVLLGRGNRNEPGVLRYRQALDQNQSGSGYGHALE